MNPVCRCMHVRYAGNLILIMHRKSEASIMDGKSKPAPLAYQNEPFLNSPDGRILRLLAEYAEPLSRFRREQIQDTVVFFGSARFHSRLDAQKTLTELEKGLGHERAAIEHKRALTSVDMARY